MSRRISSVDPALPLLLIIAGDVEQNPGPIIKWPCGTCGASTAVNRNPNSTSVGCNSCNRWFHVRCCIAGRRQDIISEASQHKWSCFGCTSTASATDTTAPSPDLQATPALMTTLVIDIDTSTDTARPSAAATSSISAASDQTATSATSMSSDSLNLTSFGSSIRERCDHCNKTIRQGQSPLQCQSCPAVCHKCTSCSGLARYRTDQPPWTCRNCRPQIRPVPMPATLCGRPLPPIMETISDNNAPGNTSNQLPHPERASCHLCKKAFAISITPLRCSTCPLLYHKNCARGKSSRSAHEKMIAANQWRCMHCTAPPVKNEAQQVPPNPSGKGLATRGKLVILQWNADGISTKTLELEHFLKDHHIDVALIQETHLTQKSADPVIQGYRLVRLDRPPDASGNHRGGGGLATYVREDVHLTTVRRCGPIPADCVMEHQSVSVLGKRGEYLHLTNIYAPPLRAHDDRTSGLHVGSLPSGRNDFVAGDFNAHSHLWDPIQPADNRGEEVEDWLINNQFGCANEGEPTRINRATAGFSSPDIMLCHQSHLPQVDWQTSDPLSSDHLPIITTIPLEVAIIPPAAREFRWLWGSADWPAFTETMESWATAQLPAWNALPVEAQAEAFQTAILKAAHLHIKRAPIRPRSKDWITPEIREKIKSRNRLFKQVRTQRQDWLQACQEVQELIRDSKRQRWQEFLEDLDWRSDYSKIWGTIRSLSGRTTPAAKNDILFHKEKPIADPNQKADVFALGYAAVSRISIKPMERRLGRELSQRLRNTPDIPDPSNEFSMTELVAVLASIKTQSAAGPDGICNRFLKALGPCARSNLLRLLNASWETDCCPQVWRNALIIPLLKAGKPASAIDSYRPISLTSAVVKTMERLVGNRLYHLVEHNGMLSEHQAGFRRQRSTEDQVLGLTQHISDCLQFKPAHRTVLALLDYSKAYDTVWREKLLHIMLDKGLPPKLVSWCASFLTNRQARVRLHGRDSRSVNMQQGLPQGSVLSPLLFLLYINGVADVVGEDVKVFLYADDVAVCASSASKADATSKLQRTLDKIAAWSSAMKLRLNPAKCEVAAFSAASIDVDGWRPELSLNGSPLGFTKTPTFLGVTLDSQLSFIPHANNVAKRVSARCRMLASLAGKDWGWRAVNLHRVFGATMSSLINYCSPAWQPWLSPSGTAILQRVQNKALRIITGCLSTTPVEALHRETDVPLLSTQNARSSAIAMERSLRLHPSRPRRQLAEGTTIHRKARGSWRQQANQEVARVGLTAQPRTSFPPPSDPPWNQGDIHWRVHLSESAINPRRLDLQARIAAAEEDIKPYLESAKWVAYTDGAYAPRKGSGSAAIIVTLPTDSIGSAIHRNLHTTISRTNPANVPAYEAEIEAIGLAVEWLNHQTSQDAAIIACDCTAVLRGLQRPGLPNQRLSTLRQALSATRRQITLLWTPSGSAGNTEADRVAKAARSVDPLPRNRPVPISFATAKSTINRIIQDPPPSNQGVLLTYHSHPRSAGNNLNTCPEAAINRQEEVLLRQIRTGHCHKFAAYRAQIDPTVDPACPRCHAGLDTAEHWLLECRAICMERRTAFGDLPPDRTALTLRTEGVASLSRLTNLL